MKHALSIADLPLDATQSETNALTHEQMQRIAGGRSVLATVDGRGSYTIDDWQMNIAIFEGRVVGTQREN